MAEEKWNRIDKITSTLCALVVVCIVLFIFGYGKYADIKLEEDLERCNRLYEGSCDVYGCRSLAYTTARDGDLSLKNYIEYELCGVKELVKDNNSSEECWRYE